MCVLIYLFIFISIPYTAFCSFSTSNCMHDFWNSLFKLIYARQYFCHKLSDDQSLFLPPCCSLTLLAFSAKWLNMFNFIAMMTSLSLRSIVLGPNGFSSLYTQGCMSCIWLLWKTAYISVAVSWRLYHSFLFFSILFYFNCFIRCIVHDCSLMNGGSSQHQLLLTGLQLMGKMLLLGIIMWSSFLHSMIRSSCE